MKNRLIDCTQKPFVNEGFTIITHDTTLGQIKWNRKAFDNCIYMPPYQRECNTRDRFIRVCEIYGELLSYNAELLNGNVLDFLIDNPDQIPVTWQKYSFIHFFGTILAQETSKCVPTLKKLGDGQWTRTLVSLKQGFNGIHFPAAVTPKFIKMELEKHDCTQWGLCGW